MLFYRQNTDGQKTDCTRMLHDLYGGTFPTACWIVGAGPSLHRLTKAERVGIAESCSGKFAMNYAGRGRDGEGWIVRPNLWTTFDPTGSFSPAVMNDPSILKFCRAGRAMDLVPGQTGKLCDCPGVFFFADEHKDYSNFLDHRSDKINNSLDSFIQAVDLAIHLGFRNLFLIGTEMAVRPSPAQIEFARSVGVKYDSDTFTTTVVEYNRDGVKTNQYDSDLLSHFLRMVRIEGGMSEDDAVRRLEDMDREGQYAFDETKSFRAAVNSDRHYWDRVQYLRLARKTLSRNGIRIVSCTPQSRLNTYFPFMPVKDVLKKLEQFGSHRESTVGKYLKRDHSADLPYHRDIKPYRPPQPKKVEKKGKTEIVLSGAAAELGVKEQPKAQDVAPPPAPLSDIRSKLKAIVAAPVVINEVA